MCVLFLLIGSCGDVTEREALRRPDPGRYHENVYSILVDRGGRAVQVEVCGNPRTSESHKRERYFHIQRAVAPPPAPTRLSSADRRDSRHGSGSGVRGARGATRFHARPRPRRFAPRAHHDRT